MFYIKWIFHDTNNTLLFKCSSWEFEIWGQNVSELRSLVVVLKTV